MAKKQNYTRLKKQRNCVWIIEAIVTISVFVFSLEYLSPLFLSHTFRNDPLGWWLKIFINPLFAIFIIPLGILGITIKGSILMNRRRLYLTKNSVVDKIDASIPFLKKHSDSLKRNDFEIREFEEPTKYKFYYKEHLIFYQGNEIHIETYVTWESLCFIYIELQKIMKEAYKLEAESYDEAHKIKTEKQNTINRNWKLIFLKISKFVCDVV